ncbi:SoxR reducing system RseC family protein [Marinobacterium marinum]|uniref:SoxR reducing system RseC family protein n=1 Tax=Marinobacterium marinum TaxID=2756129 RepID=A0A7W1WWC8_9GAMM|nr:SoxR reducing system RseC family protein [Marinobacterium marinum]MBA4501368.1 SoxR reducing system RseC family protein [Marinobacterium marinum]
MIEEVTLVSAVEARMVKVMAARTSACAQCASKSNCSQGVLSQWGQGKTVEIEVQNPDALPVKPGQQVVIGLEEGSLVRASLLLYMLPLALLIAGALLGATLALAEWQQIILAIALMLTGFGLARRLSSGRAAQNRYQPILLRIV